VFFFPIGLVKTFSFQETTMHGRKENKNFVDHMKNFPNGAFIHSHSSLILNAFSLAYNLSAHRYLYFLNFPNDSLINKLKMPLVESSFLI
jgi:hypothetical protein